MSDKCENSVYSLNKYLLVYKCCFSWVKNGFGGWLTTMVIHRNIAKGHFHFILYSVISFYNLFQVIFWLWNDHKFNSSPSLSSFTTNYNHYISLPKSCHFSTGLHSFKILKACIRYFKVYVMLMFLLMFLCWFCVITNNICTIFSIKLKTVSDL